MCIRDSIKVASNKIRVHFYFLVEVLLLLLLLLLRAAAAAYNISTEAERDSWDVYCCCCFGCFYFCPLDCDASVMVVDCAAVWKYEERGCNETRVHLDFLVQVLLQLLPAAVAAHNISTEA